MLATFCLRLALGMMAALLLFPSNLVNQRFYRSHFLIVLGLTVVAAFTMTYRSGSLVAATAAIILALFGSLAWSLDGAPCGRVFIALTTLALGAAVGITWQSALEGTTLSRCVDEFTSAAVLGTAMTAMLMGHSYLVAPSMSITPLMRLLGGLFIALLLRMAVAGAAYLSWATERSPVTLTSEAFYWLPVRWLVGFAAPLILAWMAWQAAKIRSTQSATGILYVVVILCFLGELCGLLLLESTGRHL
jgi:hypothetical protein